MGSSSLTRFRSFMIWIWIRKKDQVKNSFFLIQLGHQQTSEGEQENCKVEAQINARYSSINSEEEKISKEKIKGKKEILKDLKLDMEIEKKLQKIISRDQKKE